MIGTAPDVTDHELTPESHRASSMEPWVVLQLLLWFALVSGLVQVAAVLATRYLLGETLGMGPHLVWMIPLANVLLFLVPAILLVLATRRQDAVRARFAVIWVAAFLGFLNLTLSIPRFQQWASIVLAVGLAVTATRMATSHWSWFTRTVRRTLLPMAAGVILLALGVFGLEWAREWRSLRSLPPARAGAPNILLLVLDTVRSLDLGIYGYPRPTTPILQKLSEQGVLFENAMSPSSWTLPSHASMFTGHYAFELSADWKVPLDGHYKTLAEELREHGYLTGGFAGNLSYVNRQFGLSQGFGRFKDFTLSFGEIIASSKLGRDMVDARWFRRITRYYDFPGRKSAADLAEEFLEWVGQNPSRPFFGFINYFDAHEPYLPPEPYASAFASSNTVRNNLDMLHMQHRAERLHKQEMTPAEVQREIDAYDGGIAYTDAQIGLMLDQLGKRGLLENTIVIVTSDHGEQFGEHGFFEHGNTLYQPSVHVPLLVVGPGIPRQRQVTTPATLRDLAATVLDLAGLEQAGFPGQSLRTMWEGTPPGRRLFASLRLLDGKQLVSIRDGDFYYIKHPRKKGMLFNLRADPSELTDIIDTPAMKDVVASLGSSIDSALGERSMNR